MAAAAVLTSVDAARRRQFASMRRDTKRRPRRPQRRRARRADDYFCTSSTYNTQKRAKSFKNERENTKEIVHFGARPTPKDEKKKHSSLTTSGDEHKL